VLLDLDLGADGDGAALIAPLAERGVRVLVVTGSADRLRVAAALEQGAIGYRRKDDGFDELLDVTCRALDGQPVLTDSERSALLCELARARREQQQAFAPFERLTEREREVLEALAEGRSVRELADEWVVSDTTIRAHVRGVLAKLGTSSQLGAVAAGLRSGWLGRNVHTHAGV
jgi:DNA-binding NarL/FixJ family response regulator